MLSINNFISLIALLVLLSSSAKAETLADIYQSAVKHDPIAGAAKASYKANKET